MRDNEQQLMRHACALFCLLTIGLVGAPAADAQLPEWTGTAFANINFAGQGGDRSFSESLSAPIYDEVATYDVGHDIAGGGFFDVSGGVRVWSSLAAGLGVTRFSKRSGAAVTGQIPHPLFFDRPRSATFSRTDLEHTETGIHLQAVWVVPVRDRIGVSVFGGPSSFSVDQSIITSVTSAEIAAPFDVVNISGVATSTVSESAVGGHVGVDVTYLVTEQLGGSTGQLGAGVFVRWAGASVDLPASGGVQPLDVGGAQYGIGLRVRF